MRIFCEEKIALYHNKIMNGESKGAKTDSILYDLFRLSHDVSSLTDAIKVLFQNYGLHRMNPIKNSEHIVAQCLLNTFNSKVVTTCTSTSLSDICSDFYNIRTELQVNLKRPKNDFPEVSLSKLLHFFRPNTFWIIDRKILNVCSLMGYGDEYCQFAQLLKHLFDNPLYVEFVQYIKRINSQYVNNSDGFPILKIIDKILYY